VKVAKGKLQEGALSKNFRRDSSFSGLSCLSELHLLLFKDECLGKESLTGCTLHMNAKICCRCTRSAGLPYWSVCQYIGTFLTPLVPAKKASRFMNAYQLTALGTGPPFLFVSHEVSYAELLYVHEIVNHTHPILGSITLIQVI
jgi:hypothetical protein